VGLGFSQGHAVVAQLAHERIGLGGLRAGDDRECFKVGAKAAVVRLKVSVPTSVGVMSVYPSDVSLPPNSTIQFDANEPELSMGAIVALSTLANDLAVGPNKMTAGGTVHLLIDVLGYFQ
jgi:hypothetical protein